jgi:C1A family cysteine protease
MTENDYKFINFITRFGKSYGTVEEFNFRAAHFKRTDDSIAQINAEQNTHVAAHNKFSDYTPAEYKRMMGLEGAPTMSSNAVHEVTGTPANNIDWRTTGWLTGVKDQGACGSCWAFSTTGSTEPALAIAGHGLFNLSEQQLVSCSSAQGNNGCGGGWYYWAWDYMRSTSLESESSYPYTSGNGVTGTCRYNASLGVAKVTGYTQVAGNSNAIRSAINLKPVSVAIEADTAVF